MYAVKYLSVTNFNHKYQSKTLQPNNKRNIIQAQYNLP